MESYLSKADQLETRLISLTVEVIRLSSKLPRTLPGRHISVQILRSGTAPAANYGEARGAESRSDFIHKLRIVLKELNETAIWLRIISAASLIAPEQLVAIVAENHELSKMIAASVKTASLRAEK
jgi:four helix bundle protein